VLRHWRKLKALTSNSRNLPVALSFL